MAYEAGDFTQAAKDYAKAIGFAEQYEPKGEFLIAPLIYLSVCHSARRDYEQAEKLLRRALEIGQSDATSDPVLVALNYHELSILLWRTGRQGESQEASDLALVSLDRSKQEPAELRVMILRHQAVLLSERQRYDEAQRLLDSATNIVLSSSSLGKHSLAYGQVLVTKALVCIDSGKSEQAQELYLQGIQIIEMYWGAHHPKVAELYEIFAVHSDHAGKEDMGAVFRKQAHELREWIKREYRPTTKILVEPPSDK